MLTYVHGSVWSEHVYLNFSFFKRGWGGGSDSFKFRFMERKNPQAIDVINISFHRSTILRNLIIYTYIGLHSYFSDVTCTMTWKKNHLYRYSAIIERKLQTHSSTKTCITTYITTASTSSIMGEGGWGWGVGTLAERIMFHSCPC